MGHDLIGLTRYDEAIEHLAHALELLSPIEGTRREQAACVQTIARALFELGRGEEALAKLAEAEGLLEEVQAPGPDFAVGYRLAGEALRRGGEVEAALERFGRALELYDAEQDREELWQAYYG